MQIISGIAELRAWLSEECAVAFIVPMLRVGTMFLTLRVASDCVQSVNPFPRGAWEQWVNDDKFNQHF